MSSQRSARGLGAREKLLTYGAQSLSDVELLAVLISSGSAQRSCIELAHDLIQLFGDIRAVLNADLQAFQQIPGLGVVRYLQLQAAREICQRSDFIGLQRNIRLVTAQQTYTFLKRRLRDKSNEVIAAVFLDSQYRVLAYEELFSGTINASNLHSRPIVQKILKLNAAALILAHNHPSGLSDASAHDIEATHRIRKALELVDARLLDHFVIGDNEVYSIMGSVKLRCH